jgi:type I restriction enzyme S subunit
MGPSLLNKPVGLAVPERWPLGRMSQAFRHVDTRSTEGTERLLSITKVGGVVPRDTITDAPPRAESLVGYKLCAAGDLVVNQMSVYDGLMGVAPVDGLVTYHYLVFRPLPDVDPRFFSYLLRTDLYRGDFGRRVRGLGDSSQANVRTPHIRISDFLQTIVPLPPVEEQRRIADFLDDQVRRIDEAIAGKRAEAESLHDIYRSRLAQAFGTQPTPDFLEGLEGGGVRLGLLCDRMVAGGTPTSSDETFWADDGVPWISISDMADGGITEWTDRAVSPAGLAQARLQVQPAGALLLAMYASVGKVSISGMPAVWNQAILGLTLRQDVPQGFVVAWLELARPSLPAIARSATQDNLNADQVRRLRVPVMNAIGMQSVAVARSNARNWLGQTSLQIEQSVSLLEERKRALITAAVTGKLDVTTAKPINMGRWVPGVGADVPPTASSAAPRLGGI